MISIDIKHIIGKGTKKELQEGIIFLAEEVEKLQNQIKDIGDSE